MYSFNHRTSGNPWPTWTGAAHGYEIDHVFGVPSRPEHRSIYKDEERTLSNVVMTYWTNFAKTGLALYEKRRSQSKKQVNSLGLLSKCLHVNVVIRTVPANESKSKA